MVIGGGIAGLSAAIEASKYGSVILLTKGKIGESATRKAQGGIAAAIDKIKDSTQFHFEDTMAAGAGLCNEEAVRILVNEGVERVKELIEMGAQFDRAETESSTGFALTLEGAHKRRRILHAGDHTGEEIERTLGSYVIQKNCAQIFTHTIGIDLIIEKNKCTGCLALDQNEKNIKAFLAKNIILATGGIGQLYLYNTNPESATGDGIAMAYRAGAEVQDMEFVQFHPTSLVHSKSFQDIIALPRFLISEAVRGEGGVLLNNRNEKFMEKYHEMQELAPRDIVSRAIFQEMQETQSDFVYLSLKEIGTEKIKKRFPVIYQTCLERGLDITKDNIPVAPAAHYFMGGIKTDINGETNIENLYAAGECACLGIHGANRLASNSLLDGLVFGYRCAKCAGEKTTSIPMPQEAKNLPNIELKPHLKATEILRMQMVIKTAMWQEVGLKRSADLLKKSLNKSEMVQKQVHFIPGTKDEIEIRNMAQCAKLITQAALDRTESRGAHFRKDYPEKDDKNWKKHLTYKKES